ncbi:tRNA isopentenyltransferase [Daedalea quercina L-15889]|uniref:tRNA isopentenyltransferase n=1 Tax=Daedalea quercina L-15889 TaxID=1314783 RepID=A0A165Q660_9APHY|nr:tRNA isopentenyltransferase [Daedalea quercina L-15889]
MAALLRPLITICGTTGVGKSKLAVELALALAQKFESGTSRHGYRGARIINADAMQVYAGMDVITNKISVEEMRGVEHLLMSFKRPGEQYIITEWVKDAIHAIDETYRMGQVPIVVGGTSYWIQHLLFPNRLVSLESSSAYKALQGAPPTSGSLTQSLASLPPELLDLFHTLPTEPPPAADQPELASAMHQLLSALDPPIGQRLHWRDTRKTLRQLNIIKESGRLSSEILAEQSLATLRPRYRTLLFWLYARPDILKPRLDLRVDQMVEKGLLDEIRILRAQTSADTGSVPSNEGESGKEHVNNDYTLGIYQSIGYKEFHDYLSAPAHNDAVFQEATQSMKTATRRYTNRQNMWIRNKLLPAARAANAASRSEDGCDIVPTYVLDASELGSSWDTNVRDMAQDITDAFLNVVELPNPLFLSSTARDLLVDEPKNTIPPRKLICEICTHDDERPVMIDEGAHWKAHIRTRHHRKRVVKLQVQRLKDPHARESTVKNERSDTLEDSFYEISTLYS